MLASSGTVRYADSIDKYFAPLLILYLIQFFKPIVEIVVKYNQMIILLQLFVDEPDIPDFLTGRTVQSVAPDNSP